MFLLFEVAGEFRTIADTPENRAIVLRSWAIDRVYRLQIDLQTLRSGWPQNGDDELDGSLNLRAHEERLIRQALRQHETRRQAAAALGISHSTLQAKVKKMDGDGNGKA